MKIFLTGGTGFIGSHLLKKAIEQKFDIIALRRSIRSCTKISLSSEPLWLTKSIGEVTVEDFADVSVLIHLAAHSANVPYDTLENCIHYNVLQPLSLFQKAVEAGIKYFVIAGSCFEYGKSGERFDFIPVDAPLEPTQTYPASKAMSSIAFYQFAIQHRVKISYLRIFQVFGEGESVSRLWPSLRKAALNGEDFPMTFGAQVRDFIDVEAVAERFLQEVKEIAFRKEFEPQYLNVGSGKPQSILQFSEFWWNKWEAKGKLLVGALPYRKGEVMKFVPEI